MTVSSLVLIRHSGFSWYCRVGGVPGNMWLWALALTTEAPFRCTQMGFLEICLVWSGTSNITSRFMFDKPSLPPLHRNRPFSIQKKKIVLKIRRKLHVNYPWVSILDKMGGFHFSSCEWLYKHYLHCFPRALQHTISSAAGTVKAFLSLRLSKTAWVLQPLQANWPLLPFLLRTWWLLFPWKWLCNKSMSLILLFVTLFLTTGLQSVVCTLPTVLGRGRRTM